MRILVVGPTGERADRWKRMLNNLGAMRVTRVSPETIVVVVRIYGETDMADCEKERDLSSVQSL